MRQNVWVRWFHAMHVAKREHTMSHLLLHLCFRDDQCHTSHQRDSSLLAL